MAWGNSLIAIENVADAATAAQATPPASVPTQQPKPLFFDATLYDPRPAVTAAEAEEAALKEQVAAEAAAKAEEKAAEEAALEAKAAEVEARHADAEA